MNLLQRLWSWLTSLFAKAPALVEEDCCPEDCCEDTECGPDDDCCEEEECCEPTPEPIIEIHVKEEPTPVVVEEVEEVVATPAPVPTVPALAASASILAAPVPGPDIFLEIVLVDKQMIDS